LYGTEKAKSKTEELRRTPMQYSGSKSACRKKRPRKARSFAVEIKTASIFRGRNTAPSVFGIENKAAKRYQTSLITLSENVEFSLSKQGVLCRLVKFVQDGCRKKLSKIQGIVDLGSSLSAPPAGGQWMERVDACQVEIGARQDKQLLKQMSADG